MRHAPIGSPLHELIERTHASADTHTPQSLRVKSAPQASAISFPLPLPLALSQHMLQLKRVQFPCKLPTKRAQRGRHSPLSTESTWSTHNPQSMLVIYDSIDSPSSPPSPRHPHLFKLMFARLFYLFICYPISFHISIDSPFPPLRLEGRSVWHATHLARN